ncbi:MAG: hypothetical protein M1829_003392 [Trizodia sp. TS-e1964]|nr:MAG: hypothetical protein M1829_003392 [Trizodia sp. TS-e1964]
MRFSSFLSLALLSITSVALASPSIKQKKSRERQNIDTINLAAPGDEEPKEIVKCTGPLNVNFEGVKTDPPRKRSRNGCIKDDSSYTTETAFCGNFVVKEVERRVNGETTKSLVVINNSFKSIGDHKDYYCMVTPNNGKNMLSCLSDTPEKSNLVYDDSSQTLSFSHGLLSAIPQDIIRRNEMRYLSTLPGLLLGILLGVTRIEAQAPENAPQDVPQPAASRVQRCNGPLRVRNFSDNKPQGCLFRSGCHSIKGAQCGEFEVDEVTSEVDGVMGSRAYFDVFLYPF